MRGSVRSGGAPASRPKTYAELKQQSAAAVPTSTQQAKVQPGSFRKPPGLAGPPGLDPPPMFLEAHLGGAKAPKTMFSPPGRTSANAPPASPATTVPGSPSRRLKTAAPLPGVSPLGRGGARAAKHAVPPSHPPPNIAIPDFSTFDPAKSAEKQTSGASSSSSAARAFGAAMQNLQNFWELAPFLYYQQPDTESLMGGAESLQGQSEQQDMWAHYYGAATPTGADEHLWASPLQHKSPGEGIDKHSLLDRTGRLLLFL